MEKEAKILEFRPRNTEEINGVAVNLGCLSLAEALELEKDIRERLEDAKTDLMILRDYIDRHFREPDDAS